MITSFLLSSQLALDNTSQIFPLIMKKKFAMKEYFPSLLNMHELKTVSGSNMQRGTQTE